MELPTFTKQRFSTVKVFVCLSVTVGSYQGMVALSCEFKTLHDDSFTKRDFYKKRINSLIIFMKDYTSILTFLPS